MKLKILSLLLVFVVVTNLILFILKLINPMMFWLVIIVTGLIAYKWIPYMKNKK